MADAFTNWSGSVKFTPREHATPKNEKQVAALVKAAAKDGAKVRPVGSGHSSTPLMNTADVLVSLEKLVGLVSADGDAERVQVLPGTPLSKAGELMASEGLGMENLGDVDYQALAGAIGTGTHGTGITLGNLSQTLVGGRLVTGAGEVIPFGEDAGADFDRDLLYAAQVSLGALGVMTSLTLRVLPAYDLHRINWCTHIDWVLENYDELAASNRHFDFYWYPRSDVAQARTLNKVGEEPGLEPPGAHVHEELTSPSYEIIPNDRDLRFEEMEYMLPLADGLECFREVRQRVKDRHRQKVAWRVLVRTIKGDDAFLSPSYQRDTMTIATLQNNELPYEEYFNDIEPMLQSAGGRPHWGKKHTMKAAQLRELYPEWDTFQRVREQLDPHGTFMNEHLRELFIEEAA